ncbi:MAG: aspartate dehydrogenase [Candidatus Bathyarchaeota archaeon]|nr:MAG: aspartate dehydrogenase [Candidatus Bathyarchaeota archaeon]
MVETKDTKKVGIIGCGAIGTLIAEAVEQKRVACDELILYDHNEKKAEKLKSYLSFPVTVVASLDEMLRFEPKVIVEAASQQAAREYVEQITAEDIDLIVMSSGALLGLNVQSSKVHVPSGAIGGLDALASAALAGIDEVLLTTRKNPKAFDLNNKEPKVVYEGRAEEAARLYPREMNVAATLALTVKPAKVRVQVVSDPAVQRNRHEFQVKWRFGEMFLCFMNDPHPENPRTSALAAWSAIKLLQLLLEK